jgi:DNA-binding transcriptional LysR family regulator
MKNGAGQEVVAGARPVMVLDDPEAIARAAARGIGIGIAIAIAMLPLPHVLPA